MRIRSCFRRAAVSVICRALAVVLVGSGLCACGAEIVGESNEGTAFVYSARQNQPIIDAWASSPSLDQEVREAAEGHGVATVHPTDGGSAEARLINLKVRTESSQIARSDQKESAKRIRQALAESKAKVPEADVLAGISAAANQVRGKGDPTIIVIDNGLSTVGSLSLPQTGLLQQGVDIDQSVSAMSKLGLLPDLTGIKVRWIGMGLTVPPQEKLDQAALKRLTDLWESVVETAGGRFEPVTEAVPPLQDLTGYENLPKVSAVDTAPVSFTADVEKSSITVSFPDSVLPFVPESTDFLDPAAANVTVSALAQQITDAKAVKVTVTGCTATYGSPEGRKVLSQGRAQAVATLLSEHGVPQEKILVEGLGSDCAGRVPDLGADRQLLEGPARANRVVKVTFSMTAKQ